MNRTMFIVALVAAVVGGGGWYALHDPPPVSRSTPQQFPRRPAPGTPSVGQAVPRPSGPTRPRPGSGEIVVRTPSYFLPPPGVDLGWYGRYGYPYPYGYPPVWYVERPDSASGQLRLDVSQKDATVYVDGFYVGVVDDFNGIFHHLTLAAGPHRIEIRKPGYETLIFDVNIQPNQTVTYREAMQSAHAEAGNAAPSGETSARAGDTTNPLAGAPLPGMFMGPPGDVRFEVSPKDAQVYADGFYVGIVDDFNGRSQHLTLAPGAHHVIIRADGYEALEVDLNIQPRQTMTYRGDLKRSTS